MNNEEKILTILERMDGRMDKLDSRMDKLDGRVDKLDGRVDKLEYDMNLEFYAVREEMNMVYKSFKEKIV